MFRPERKKLVALLAGAAAAILMLVVLDQFVMESVLIPSSSMRPTILPNERAFLQRVCFTPLKRFDVVVVNSSTLGHRIVKRVVALPGERVRLEDSWKVYVNDKPLDYADVPNKPSQRLEGGSHLISLKIDPRWSFETNYGKSDYVLGPNQYFVLGDNRLASHDGRGFGPVKLDEIQGRLRTVWYSFDKKIGSLRSDRSGTSIQ